MRNYFLGLIALAALFNRALAQDQLFKKDNTKLLVKIREINSEEIKYQLFDNLKGPMYSESKANVSLIIYENGQHEVITYSPATINGMPVNMMSSDEMSKKDSVLYYGHSNNISINFFNFFNNELSITYQKEFFKSQFNIIIPVAIGIEKPGVTQSVYFGRTNYSSGVSSGNSYYTLNKKLFDVGFGINYYPSLRTNINYYIGPVFKYMQYSGRQSYDYTVPATGPNAYPSRKNISKNTTLTRYTMSITNGVILRTRSRITASLYGSLGFKNDTVDDEIVDPVANKSINAINNSASLFFWCGFNVGFNF